MFDRIFKFVEKIIPLYAIVPLLIFGSFNMITYLGTQLFIGNRQLLDMTCIIDRKIPFVPAMMVVYLLAFATWIIGYIVFCRESKEMCYYILAAELISKSICFIIYIAFPSTMERPIVIGHDFFSELTRFVYTVDRPLSLFPSIHCLESWLCFRASLKCKKVGNGFRVVMFIAALLVFASTLMVKQHVFVDMIAGVAAIEIGFLAAKKLKAGRIYYNFEKIGFLNRLYQ